MKADVELAGAVRYDDGVVQQALRRDRAPQRPLAGDADGVGVHRERGDAERLEMRRPGRAIGKGLRHVIREPADHLS